MTVVRAVTPSETHTPVGMPVSIACCSGMESQRCLDSVWEGRVVLELRRTSVCVCVCVERKHDCYFYTMPQCPHSWVVVSTRFLKLDCLSSSPGSATYQLFDCRDITHKTSAASSGK